MDPTRSHELVEAFDDSYSDAEQERLATNLLSITERVHSGEFRGVRHDGELLVLIHAKLFEGVAAHAGHVRNEHWGSERLTFGPNRSEHRRDVPSLLEKRFLDLERSIRSFDENQDDQEYSLRALDLASWIHADLIGIHPFQDGNGRSTRLFMNAVLIRLGLRPIALEACKDEYCECLNHYFRTGVRKPLVDLLLQLYASQVRAR